MSLKKLIFEEIENWHSTIAYDEKVLFGDRKKDYIIRDKLSKLPSFKKWFDNSITVNAQGKPLLFYHGSEDETFEGDVFKPDRNGLIFFTTSPSEALRYGDNLSKFFVRCKSIYDFKDDKEYILENYKEFKREFSGAMQTIWGTIYEVIGDEIEDDNEYEKLKLDIETKTLSRDLLNIWLEYPHDIWMLLETEFMLERMKSLGNDGFITYESGSFNIGIFDNHNIKIADGTNTTFDNSNNFRK